MEVEVSNDSHEELPFAGPRATLVGFWVVLGLVVLVKSVLPDFLLFFFVVPVHELGHAAMSWLGGRFAIPIGAIIPMAAMTWSSYNRNLAVYTLLAGLLGFTAYRSLKQDRQFLFVLSLGLLFFQYRLSFKTSADHWQMWMVFGGVGGEFVLGLLMSVLFFHRLPERLRWDFFRFVFLAIGLLALYSASVHWSRIYNHRAEIPWGTFLNGGGDSGGDMARLRDDFGWAPERISGSYRKLGQFCWIALGLQYCYSAWEFFRSRSRR